MTNVYVAAGSNVEPEKHLSLALHELSRLYPPLKISPAYRNEAVGFEGDDFINLVVGFATDDPVACVRERLQRIESLCDRPPNAPKWAPRTMDLDILLYGQLVSDQPGFVIPRPDLLRRPYMLKPLADIAPEVVHPVSKVPIGELWERFEGKGHEMREVGQLADWPTGRWPE